MRQRWRDVAFANARRGRGLGPKNPKSSFGGSVSGAPCETAMEGMGEDGGMAQMRPWWWWGRAVANASEGVEGRKPETKPLWLGSGPAVSNGDGGGWRVVVECPVRNSSGHGRRVHKHKRGERGLGPKAQN
jgi:hypothetical protein